MVYRCLDPAADWDAWCDDHPEPPEPEDVDEEFHIYTCPVCKHGYCHEEIEEAKYVHTTLAGDVLCTDCLTDGCKHPTCELSVDMEAFEKHCKEEAADAEAERALDRMDW